MLYIGTLLLMDHEDGSYQIYDPTEQSGDDYDRVIWDGVARTAEMTYNSISGLWKWRKLYFFIKTW